MSEPSDYPRRKTMQHRPKLIRLLAIAVVMALVLVACAGTEPDSAETTAAGTDTPATTSPTTGGTSETTSPPSSGEKPVIVAALGDTVNIVEPHTFRSTAAYAVTDALYEPCLLYTSDAADDLTRVD